MTNESTTILNNQSHNLTITVLKCNRKTRRAAKTFKMDNNKLIYKSDYNIGTYVTYEVHTFSNQDDLYKFLFYLADQPSKFIIMGAPKKDAGDVVRRKFHEPYAAFDRAPSYILMMDIDKVDCPEHLDPYHDPEGVIDWIQQMLPAPFIGVKCYYQFSASQNIPYKDGKLNGKVSVHLWFVCDRLVSDTEWKRYFKSVSAPVDCNIYNPVHPLFTANPIFENMPDPLPNRNGIFKGKKDIVTVPEIPEEKKVGFVTRPQIDVIPDDNNCKKAIELILPHYKKGLRNKLCSALAGTLYRHGWNEENTSDFILQLAQTASDDEAHSRYKNALRACDSINSNNKVPGIPTLKELDINIDEVLPLLGINNDSKIDTEISKLDKEPSIKEIEDIICKVAFLPKTKQEYYIQQIKNKTKFNIGPLREMVKEAKSKNEVSLKSEDLPYNIMVSYVDCKYANGNHLLHSIDGNYWNYIGTHWGVIDKKKIEGELLVDINDTLAPLGKTGVSPIQNQCMRMLPGYLDSLREYDPFEASYEDIPSVINSLNSEIWIGQQGGISLKPHRPDSYLRNCLNVKYDPNAKAPKFYNAVIDIFSNSSDPHGMFLHFMELIGYICQPSREHAIIVLFHGNGSNGKTSLMRLIERVIGPNNLKKCRLNDIENSSFKVGGLDGKLMVVDDDVDVNTVINDGFVKKISEEKTMTGEHKFKDEFNFVCRAIPVMLANHFPKTRDLSLGFRRRLMVIPFYRSFEFDGSKKPNIFNPIWEEEGSGILNYIIQGVSNLKKRGNFQEPKDCIMAREDWIKNSNNFTYFIAEECKNALGQRTSVRELFKAYDKYCTDEYISQKLQRRNFKKNFVDLGYKTSRIEGEYYVWDLILAEYDFVTDSERSEPTL
ncbi:MAG: phage/plasmid primase, P4 family [Rickettsiales bacterium]|nr:phage/plasmid primase, P4 family [Pseudomonadota bacterium]MDG4544109.1 phage/plasmid primase, P4 family [Rickettsiales bacterium]MDG4546290.1 phage/plasmid primase, P4 family [Rickettsiales bacterium]MDG4548433.1 phage/plasmid primase, P4 family [Rickettsiales bacterium]